MRRIAILSALLYSTALFAQSGIISTNRSADWTHAGINGYSTSGNLPSASWTQCGPTIAAYSGTGATILNALQHTGSGYTGCGANTYVQLAAGTFTLSTGIYSVGVSNTELRGAGANQTHLVFTGNSTCQGGNGSCMIGFDSSDNTDPTSPGPSTIVNWTGGYSKGSTVLNVSNLSNIIANVTEAVMDQCDTGYSGATCAGTAVDNGQLYDCGDKYATTPTGCSVNGPDTGLARPHRFELEAAMVTACSPACGTNSAGTITIDTPLLNPDWGSRTPQVWFFTPLQYVGIQNLSVDDSAVQSNIGGVSFKNCAHCWARGIAVLHAYNIGIYLVQTIHSDITSNYVFDAGQHLTYSDPTGIKYNWSSNIVANNIVQAVRPALMCEGPCAGNVIIANYTINNYTGDDFLFGGEWDGHSNGADYDLIESNVVDQLTEDLIHGGHWMQTNFRNFATGWESCANGQCGSLVKDVSGCGFDAKLQPLSELCGQCFRDTGPGSDVPDYDRHLRGFLSSICSCHLDSELRQRRHNSSDSRRSVRPYNRDALLELGHGQRFDTVQHFGSSDRDFALSQHGPRGGMQRRLSGQLLPQRKTLMVACLDSVPCHRSRRDRRECRGLRGRSERSRQVWRGSGYDASQCAGQGLNAAWAGHVNAIPAMACYFLMGGPPDGSGGALTFNPSACYAGGTPTTATPAQGAPNFSGTYNVPPTVLPLSVTWTDSTPGASIFCTTDGSTPTPSSPAYAPYSLTHTTTIRCIATAPGFLNSGIGGGVWTIVSGAPAAPTNLTGTTSVTGSAIIQ